MKTVESITKELAGHLDGWEHFQPKHAGHHPKLVAPNGASVWLRTVSYRLGDEVADTDRLEFYVTWPEAVVARTGGFDSQYFRPHDRTLKITVAASRTIASIAKDVERRLLRRYLPKYAEMLELKAKYLERDRITKANARRIAEALGTDYEGNARTVRTHGDVWSSFEVNDDQVNVKLLYVPISLALEVARLLRVTP